MKKREPSGEHPGPIYARALLEQLPQKRIGVREVAAALALDLREVDADGFDGALIRAKDVPLGAIAVRKSIREAGRKNFTIAHEIGHFVLPGHNHASVACLASEVGNWADRSVEKELEREADEFAAELLMPASLVEDISKDVTPSLQIIERIARKAGTSLSAAAWRFCDLTSERCAVVWSTDGMIEWVKRSSGFSFFLPGRKRIEEGTFAAACFREAKVPKRPREISAALWIGPGGLDSSVAMMEQSKALPAYRSVISLLWIQEAAVITRES